MQFDLDLNENKSPKELLLDFLKKRIEAGKEFRKDLKQKYPDLLPEDYDN